MSTQYHQLKTGLSDNHVRSLNQLCQKVWKDLRMLEQLLSLPNSTEVTVLSSLCWYPINMDYFKAILDTCGDFK